jgi:sigma-E factor negative regulatory protein RseA
MANAGKGHELRHACTTENPLMKPESHAAAPPLASNDEQKARLNVSMLMDGHCSTVDAFETIEKCAADGPSRQAWAQYHLIGDVLRSSTMATSTAVDVGLLANVRERLAAEPYIAAPQAMADAPRRGSRPASAWLMGGAIAAGFIAVAGVLVVSRTAVPGAESPVPLLAQGVASSGVQRASVVAGGGNAAVDPLSATLIRDAQIDSYLRAHRDMRGNATAALPGGVLRSVDTIVPQR